MYLFGYVYVLVSSQEASPRGNYQKALGVIDHSLLGEASIYRNEQK